MNEFELWLVGIALAMDCLTVSLATGIARRHLILRPMAVMALSFGLFQGGMFALGTICTSAFLVYIQAFDHWIAFALLAYMGGQMIYGDLWGEEEEKKEANLSISNILTMAIATSIDALAVGVSYACVEQPEQGVSFLLATWVIAFCSLMFSVVGLTIGILACRRLNWHMEAVGGLVLLIIGVKILCEHLK